MIDEKKLVEELKENNFDILMTDADCFGLEKCTENVIELINKQQKVGEWIPCSEALPPKLEENHGIDKKPVYLVSVNGEDYPHRALWNGRCFTDGFLILEVVAWMPLPEPYKGE